MADVNLFELVESFYTGGLSTGRLPLYSTTLRGGRGRTHWCHNLRELVRLCARFKNTRRVELGLAAHDTDAVLAIAKQRLSSPNLAEIRGAGASVVVLPALWAVIRFGSAPLPPDLRAALGLLEAIEHRPAVAVSGAGKVWVFWPLDEPLRLLDTATAELHRAQAVAHLRRLAWAIARRAEEHGWQLPESDTDLAAAFPLPGSPLGADAKGPRAVLESYPLVAGDGRFRLGDFAQLPEAPPAAPRPWQAALAPPPDVESGSRLAPLAPIVRGCSWLRHCHTDRARLGTGELAHATRLLLRCDAPGADRTGLVHELYGGHAAYDPHDVEKKIRAALRAQIHPITCTEIGTTPGVVERHCAPCTHRGRIRGPLDLARQATLPASGTRSAERDTDPCRSGAVAPARREPIPITDPQHAVNDRALAALAGARAVFEHAGSLVEVVTASGSAPALRPVRAPRLRELLSRHCRFVAPKGGQLRPARPPRWTVRALIARGSWPELERIDGAGHDFPSAPTSQPPKEETSPCPTTCGPTTMRPTTCGSTTAMRPSTHGPPTGCESSMGPSSTIQKPTRTTSSKSQPTNP